MVGWGRAEGCQTTAVEEAGVVGGRAFSRSGHWRALWRNGAGWDQRRRRRLRRAGLGICGPPWAKLGKWSPFSSVVAQSTLHTQLTLSRGAGGGAPLRAHTVRGILPRGGRCCRLTHLDWRHQRLWLRGDPQHCRSVRRCMQAAQRGDGGLGTGSWVALARSPRDRRWTGTVSRQCPLHKGGEIRSRAILGRRRSVRDVQAGVVERTERIVRVAGEDQKQSGVTLERSLPLLQQEEEEFRAKEGIHGAQRKKKTLRENEKQMEGRRRGYCFGWSFCHKPPGSKERGSEEYFKTQSFNKSKHERDTGTQGMTFKDQQTLTERTGAFKDRVTRELRRHTWDQIKQSDMREKLGHRTGGAKTQNSPGAWQFLLFQPFVAPLPTFFETYSRHQIWNELI